MNGARRVGLSRSPGEFRASLWIDAVDAQALRRGLSLCRTFWVDRERLERPAFLHVIDLADAHAREPWRPQPVSKTWNTVATVDLAAPIPADLSHLWGLIAREVVRGRALSQFLGSAALAARQAVDPDGPYLVARQAWSLPPGYNGALADSAPIVLPTWAIPHRSRGELNAHQRRRISN